MFSTKIQQILSFISRMQSHVASEHPGERIWRCDCSSTVKYVHAVVKMCYQVEKDGDFVCAPVPSKESSDEVTLPERESPTPDRFRVVVRSKVEGGPPKKKKDKKKSKRKKKKKHDDKSSPQSCPDYSWLEEGTIGKKNLDINQAVVTFSTNQL